MIILVAEKQQRVKIEKNSERTVDDDDTIGNSWRAIGLGVVDGVGGDGTIDRDRGENERAEVRERVGEKRVQATHEQGLVAQDETEVRDEYEIAEAEQEHVEIDEAEKGQVDECGVLAHLSLGEHQHGEEIAEQTDDEQEHGGPFGQTRVEVVLVGDLLVRRRRVVHAALTR